MPASYGQENKVQAIQSISMLRIYHYYSCDFNTHIFFGELIGGWFRLPKIQINGLIALILFQKYVEQSSCYVKDAEISRERNFGLANSVAILQLFVRTPGYYSTPI